MQEQKTVSPNELVKKGFVPDRKCPCPEIFSGIQYSLCNLPELQNSCAGCLPVAALISLEMYVIRKQRTRKDFIQYVTSL